MTLTATLSLEIDRGDICHNDPSFIYLFIYFLYLSDCEVVICMGMV